MLLWLRRVGRNFWWLFGGSPRFTVKWTSCGPRKPPVKPSKAYPGDSCYDVFALDTRVISAYSHAEIDLGFAIELPLGVEARFRTRSGHGKRGLQVHPGTIDSGFRGRLSVFVFNYTEASYTIRPGDKIAQMSIVPTYAARFVYVEKLNLSVRGERGYGSSGR